MIRQTIQAQVLMSSEFDEKKALHKIDVEAPGQHATSKVQRNEKEDAATLQQLFFCCMGIYASYLVYGTLQEDIFTYSSSFPLLGVETRNKPFHYVWLVQVVEALTNSTVSLIGFIVTSKARVQKRSVKPFVLSGFSQVTSKAFTSLSLASGLSFPIATLSKSGKMAPIMIGQYFLGKSRYSLRDYAQVAMIVGGTATLGLSRSNDQTRSHSSSLAVTFILLSLVMDGITGGLQKKIKCDTSENGFPVKGFEFMMYTNLFMLLAAFLISICTGDLAAGTSYLLRDPYICRLICKFCVCSAVGQYFIFHTPAIFDPLVCSTITTTRKILSVFISIIYRGHLVNYQGWCGISIACIGMGLELHGMHQRDFSNEGKTRPESEESINVGTRAKEG